MRFQVLSSTVSCSHTGFYLSFFVFPYKRGELKFSDGNRLVARDLTEKLGGSLTIGDMYGKTRRDDHDVLNDGGKHPLGVEVIVNDADISEYQYHDKESGFVSFLKGKEWACGYAEYTSDKYEESLRIYVSVESGVLAGLLRAIPDTPSEMFLDVEIRGLEDEPRVYWPGDFEGTWNLDDASDCGRGDYRVVSDFKFERITSNFPISFESEQLQRERVVEDRQMLAKLNANLATLVAIENDGANTVEKLLLLNLFAVLAIAAIGILALVARLF